MKPQAAHTYEDKLLEFVYGELPPAEARSVESHVKGCAKCSTALEGIQGVRRSMSGLSTEPAPDAGLESLLAYANQTARRIQSGPSARRTRWNRWVLSVAGVASLAIVGIVATRVAEKHELETPQQMAEAVVVAKKYEQPDRREESLAPAPAPVDAVESEKDVQNAPASAQAPQESMQNYTEGSRLPPAVASKEYAPPETKVAPTRRTKAAELKRKSADTSDYAQGARMDSERKGVAKAEPAETIEAVPAPETAKRGLSLPSGMASQSRVESGPESAAAAEDDDRAVVGGVAAQSDTGRAAGAASSSTGTRSAMPSAPSAAPPVVTKRPSGRSGAIERQDLMKEIDATTDRSRIIGLLSRLCELEIDMGYIQPSSCIRIEREFPGTGAARLARSRLDAQRSGTQDAQSQPAH